MRDQLAGTSVCYVLYDEEAPKRVMGFYALSAAVVDPTTIPDLNDLGLPPYNPLPATLLGKMGVDDAFAGRHLGTTLIRDAFRKTLVAAQSVGSIGMIVDPKNEQLIEWYADHDFVRLERAQSRMFIHIATIKDVLSQGSSIQAEAS